MGAVSIWRLFSWYRDSPLWRWEVVRPSHIYNVWQQSYLNNQQTCTGKMTSLYWIGLSLLKEWIYRIMHEGHLWYDLSMVFTRDFVTRENHWQITSPLTKKIVIHGTKCIILFLTCSFMFWTHNSTKNNHRSLISPSSPRTVFFV